MEDDKKRRDLTDLS